MVCLSEEDENGMILVHKTTMEYFQDGIKKLDKIMTWYREELEKVENENETLKEKIRSWGM